MIFGSIEFWEILILGVLFFYLIPNKYRWSILACSSIAYLGYLSFSFLLYALLFTVLNYFLGIVLDKQSEEKTRKRLYNLILLINIGQLVAFKYINFLIENVNSLIGLANVRSIPYIDILIPAGISYYTFQSIGYIINIYRKQEKSEKQFGNFLIYSIFFPKILSGPIERSDKFLPQLRVSKAFNADRMYQGITLIFIGLFKKFVIAERLSVLVNDAYNNPDAFSSSSLLFIMLLQAFYVYTDFSGYTSIALGIAKLFGIDLTDNFRRPFLAQNVSDFWRRWHISLSTWCNHYIFNTVIFKRRKWGKKASIYGVFITFLIIGIWHGPNWTFVILGILHGLAINYEYFTKRLRIDLGSKIPSVLNKTLSRIITFTFCSFVLIFFFGHDLSNSLEFIRYLFTSDTVFNGIEELSIKKTDLLIAGFSIVIMMILEVLGERNVNIVEVVGRQPLWVRWTLYYSFIFITLILGKFSNNNFIYFQF